MIPLEGYESFRYETYVGALSLDHAVSSKVKANFGFSVFNQNEHEDSYVEYFFGDTSPAWIEDFKNQLDISTLRFTSDVNWQANWNHQLHLGTELKFYTFEDQLNEVEIDAAKGVTDADEPFHSNKNIQGNGISNYAEYLWRPSVLLSIKTGLRFTRRPRNMPSGWKPGRNTNRTLRLKPITSN